MDDGSFSGLFSSVFFLVRFSSLPQVGYVFFQIFNCDLTPIHSHNSFIDFVTVLVHLRIGLKDLKTV